MHSPVWSVTRRQRTELSPRRDDETGVTQSFSSRTITTTERVQMIPIPDSSDVPVEVLVPAGRSETCLARTTVEDGSHSIPVISGVTSDSVPLHTGICKEPKAKAKSIRTTMTTTTTTTYSVIEIDDSEEELKVETEQKAIPENTQITLDFPLDYEVVNFDDLLSESPQEEKEHLYVVVGKKDSPTRTTDTADYVVKMIDVDLPSSESKDSPSIERISDAEIDGLMSDTAECICRHDYDAYEGTVASTSRANEIDQEPIHRYVSVYHNGTSHGMPDLEEKRISKEISTVVAKFTGGYKRASIEGEHTVYLDTGTGEISSQETSVITSQIKESPRRLKSTYTVRFSEPFRIEADDYAWTKPQNEPETKTEKIEEPKSTRKKKRRGKEQQIVKLEEKDAERTEITRKKDHSITTIRPLKKAEL
uniref:Uncharacterized protein n=1 Tax=Setaria digitata TaxID=48799 RepID=A0A915PX62_9BILA